MTSYVRYKPANIFFALVWHWAASLSKNELDTIFSNTVGANIKDSTTTISTTIHIKRNSKSIFLQKNWPQIPKMRVLGLHIISQRAWPLMRPNFVRITCSQYKYALTLTGRNSRGARNPLSIKSLRRLWQVWRGRRFCSTDQPLLLTGHQGIGPSTGFAFLSQNDLDHFHLEHIFHKSNQDQYPPSICKSSNCIK